MTEKANKLYKAADSIFEEHVTWLKEQMKID